MPKYKTVKEMLGELDSPKSLWDRFILNPKMNWLRWTIYNLPDVPRDTYNEIKYFIQRGCRGYSDRDVWNLCSYLSDNISNSLKSLEKNRHSYPMNLTDKQFKTILSDIIFTFEKEKEITEYDSYPNTKLSKEELARYNRGWRLFKKYFRSLWD